MFRKFKRWRKKQITLGEPVNNALWARTIARAQVLEMLNPEESQRLRERTILFLHEKSFTAAGGLELDRPMQLHMAAQACLLILNLNLDYFAGWHEVIVYPRAFVTGRNTVDEHGLVHSSQPGLGGEAWGRGPVILSWDDARPGAQIHGEGSNVVLHEFAHKLDMLNGANANGMPPLHHDMQRQQWTDTLGTAYEKLKQQLRQGSQAWIDPYAATNPAEFFAVISEHFFERPLWFQGREKSLYQQLVKFYRQDPAARLAV